MPGERVGTLAWNGYRHFELYYAVSGMEAVIHTINPRLFFDQLTYIVHHAEDRLIFFDLTFLPLVEKLAPHCPGVTTWIAMTDRAHLPKSSTLPNLLCYEELLAAESDDFDWPEFDENTAAGLCYTSGTTGHPKGVLFSHRSSLLHAYAVSLPDAKGYSAHSVVLPIVPMFHVNAWGIPYAAALTGAKLVLPGAGMDGASLFELFETEKVESSAGVPTVWLSLIAHMKEHRLKFSTLKYATIGGAAVPPAMVRTLADDFGLKVLHGWGMTEMSPVGTINTDKAKHRSLPNDDRFALSLKQGRPLPGVDMKIVDANGAELPWDGKSAGDLLVRGPWVLREYFRDEGGSPLTADGWLPTGDVGTIDPDGYLQITDRSKDMIKSGGEWISSIELENVGDRSSRSGRGRRHRRQASALERAAAAARRAQGRRERRSRVDARLLRGQDRQVVDARRRRVRRRAAAHGHGQAVQAHAARAVQGLPAADRVTRAAPAVAITSRA